MSNQQITHSFSTKHGARVSLGRISMIVRSLPAAPDHNLKAHPLNRQQQLLASDYLLTREIGIDDEIQRDEKGAPFLVNRSARISISHTRDHIAVMAHPAHAVGIDIELISRNISPMIPRFTTDDELHLAGRAFPQCEAIFVWSCKECLFKTMGREAVHFKEQLKLTAIEPGRVTRSLWRVEHPDLSAGYWVNSSIFDPLMVSYIDEPGTK